MADERGGMIIGDRVEARLDKLTEDVAEIKGTLIGFKMAFDQMDKRLSDLASQMDRRFTVLQWGMGLLFVMQVAIFGKLFLK